MSFPYLMVQNGYRAVYEPDARGVESMTTDIEDEFRRKVRMFEHAWLMLFRGHMFGLRRLGLTYWIELVSHRLLRYWSGPLHIVLLVTSVLLATHGWIYAAVLAARWSLAMAAPDRHRRLFPPAAGAALLPAGPWPR
jgi:hypothetical protein